MNGILEVTDLSIGYKDVVLATGITAILAMGCSTALIGRNGAGKSTLIKTLTGSLPPLKGTVSIGGRELRELSRKETARLVAVSSHDGSLAGGLRLHEYVALGRIPYTGLTGRLSRSDREIIDNAMHETGILHKRDSFVSRLSDGERQKGAIARVLVQDTPIIIMDEPFSFLDVAARLEMMELLKYLSVSRNKAILYSTHDVTEALRTADRVWMLMTDGFAQGTPDELIERGEPDRLFANPRVKFDKKTKEFIWI